jgi:four helix bundle protein
MSIQSYRDLTVWQKAMDLVDSVYTASDAWPRDELYALTNQARRAVVSVPANIAEGKGRYGAAEFLHHLSIARGSLHELETLLLIAQRRGYLTERACTGVLEQAAEVGRLLHGLVRSLSA